MLNIQISSPLDISQSLVFLFHRKGSCGWERLSLTQDDHGPWLGCGNPWMDSPHSHHPSGVWWRQKRPHLPCAALSVSPFCLELVWATRNKEWLSFSLNLTWQDSWIVRKEAFCIFRNRERRGKTGTQSRCGATNVGSSDFTQTSLCLIK